MSKDLRWAGECFYEEGANAYQLCRQIDAVATYIHIHMVLREFRFPSSLTGCRTTVLWWKSCGSIERRTSLHHCKLCFGYLIAMGGRRWLHHRLRVGTRTEGPCLDVLGVSLLDKVTGISICCYCGHDARTFLLLEFGNWIGADICLGHSLRYWLLRSWIHLCNERIKWN